MEDASSSATTGQSTPAANRRGSMTEEEERERRASIQAIMRDPNLTPHERRKSIQSLMDGRRRSSTAQRPSEHGNLGGGMAAAAAMAAAEFESSDEEEDDDVDVIEEEEEKVESNTNLLKRRSSGVALFRRNSSHLSTNGKSSKRRASLRSSFTMGFSKLGMKTPASEEDVHEKAPPPDPNALSRKMEKSRPACGHYDRNCSIVSPCCGLVFGCRICHDDSPVLPPPFLITGGQPSAADLAAAGMAGASHTMEEVASPAKAVSLDKPKVSHRSASLPSNFTEEESHHNIDRFLIKEVICRECFTRQSSKTNNCINCGIEFGGYHCNVCNLWMSADEDPYHCLKCGFCRVGGRENFTHCEDCGMCIDALLFEDHNCKSGKYMSNCPVCQEDLFSSRMASHEMPCGHAIHWHCFRELTSFDTRCPVCKKTAETHDQMEQTWNAMAMGIALQPVPTDMARVVDIICNDCEEKSINQRWHFLGVQCQKCTSFNTTVERTVLAGQQAADFLGPATDMAAQAHFASSLADQNVLTALMGGGASGAAMAAMHDGGDAMDTEALNQSVAAEVMSIMNASNEQLDFDLNPMGRPVATTTTPNQTFSNMDEPEEMEQEDEDDTAMRD